MTDVVVGAGSAGAVLAARLSQDPDRDVLLLEAGPDFVRRADVPAAVLDARAPTVELDWGYSSEPDEHGRSYVLPRGKLVGGCSATNAVFAMRGAPSDYDGWAALGNEGWAWRDVLPCFKRLETDADRDDDFHGRDGPVHIERVPLDAIGPHQRAALEAAWALGHTRVVDHNEPGAFGAGPAPRNALDDVRMSTALAYLEPARPRPNLTVRGDVLVDRVLLADGRAHGVVLADGEELPADRVILAAGAYGSPTILLRSGIGPAAELAALDIDVAVDLPGVGAALVDHPAYSVDVPVEPPAAERMFETAITWRSTRAGHDPYDMHTLPGGPMAVGDASPTGYLFFLFSSVVRPRSRGRVTLRSADPAAPPVIQQGGLAHADDLARLVEAVQLMRALVGTPPLRDLVHGDEITPGPDAQTIDEIAAAVTAGVTVYHHAAGTCPMGTDPSAGAVVDATAHVYGVDGLSVADASIIPEIPAANTNLPTIMIAEKVATLLQRR